MLKLLLVPLLIFVWYYVHISKCTHVSKPLLKPLVKPVVKQNKYGKLDNLVIESPKIDESIPLIKNNVVELNVPITSILLNNIHNSAIVTLPIEKSVVDGEQIILFMNSMRISVGKSIIYAIQPDQVELILPISNILPLDNTTVTLVLFKN